MILPWIPLNEHIPDDTMNVSCNTVFGLWKNKFLLSEAPELFVAADTGNYYKANYYICGQEEIHS